MRSFDFVVRFGRVFGERLQACRTNEQRHLFSNYKRCRSFHRTRLAILDLLERMRELYRQLPELALRCPVKLKDKYLALLFCD